MEIIYNNKLYKSNSCGEYFILKKLSEGNINDNSLFEIKFKDTNTILKVKYHNIRGGKVLDPMYPSFYNIGYMGIGEYNTKNSFNEYTIWTSMLQRCYNLKFPAYKNYGNKGVIVCKEWHNFQNFCRWYKENFNKFIGDKTNLQLDKDVLCNIYHLETKIYSPETCLLIPRHLNYFIAKSSEMTGVQNRNNRFSAKLYYKGIHYSLGTFDTFEKAKNIYNKQKQLLFIEEINKSDISEDLKNILKQYKF